MVCAVNLKPTLGALFMTAYQNLFQLQEVSLLITDFNSRQVKGRKNKKEEETGGEMQFLMNVIEVISSLFA